MAAISISIPAELLHKIEQVRRESENNGDNSRSAIICRMLEKQLTKEAK